MEMGVPVHYITWIWQFLRDRRARVERNGVCSGERIYRTGLPQGLGPVADFVLVVLGDIGL